MGVLSNLHHLRACAESLHDLGYEYQVCSRCAYKIQDYIVFEGRKGDFYSDLAPQPNSFSVILCHTCWDAVVSTATDKLVLDRTQ